MLIVLLAGAALAAPDTARDAARDTASDVAPPVVAPAAAPVAPLASAPAPDTAAPRRPRAIEYSDAYATRLTIHRIGSYAMLPLFAGEYWLGERLLGPDRQPGWVKGAHVGTAAGLGALFTVNTVTGVWNLWDARHDRADRTRRYVHSALLLAADAGFAYTGAIAGNAHNSAVGRTRHKNAALVSMGVSTVGSAMMWLWKK